ncbi:hypothetical protein IMZ48_27885, partial [Candidatus Bathyarchaeota archaeon]|nr:hypothetical protein [Candidatus Bathyarchaeota archaeon]
MQQLHRIASPSPNTHQFKKPAASRQSPHRPLPSPKRQPPQSQASFADSGYHGSQSQSQDMFDPMSPGYTQNFKSPTPVRENTPVRGTPARHGQLSPTKTRGFQSPTTTFTTAKEEQTAKIIPDATQRLASPQITRTQNIMAQHSSSPLQMPQSPSPKKSSPLKTSPVKTSPVKN